MKYDLIIFDADGTLYDFAKTELRAFNLTMQTFGLEDNLEELHQIYKKINQQIWIDFERGKISSSALRTERFERFFNQANLQLDAHKVSEKYLSHLSEGTFLLDGAHRLISQLAGKARLALATNGIADVQIPRIGKSDLADFFPELFISEELGFPKPDIRFFEAMFARIPRFEKAIIVGDNLASDIQGGINAQIDTCWYNPQKNLNELGINPTYVIGELAELLEIVK